MQQVETTITFPDFPLGLNPEPLQSSISPHLNITPPLSRTLFEFAPNFRRFARRAGGNRTLRGICWRIHGGRSDDGITAAGLFHDHLNEVQFTQHLARHDEGVEVVLAHAPRQFVEHHG